MMKLKKFIILVVLSLANSPSICFAQKNIIDIIQHYRQITDYLLFATPVRINLDNPYSALTAHTKLTLPLVFEPLISINSQQELHPTLAESWSIASDNHSITITLHQGHYFSNNAEVTANDVVDSIQRLCTNTRYENAELQNLVGCSQQSRQRKPAQIYAIDKYKVVFNISGSPTTFLYQLTSAKAAITKLEQTGYIGSGPYYVKKQSTDYIVLSRNKFYQGDMKVNNNGLVMLYSSHDELSKILKMDTLDGALMYRIQDDWHFNDKNYKLIKTNSNITKILVLNNNKVPFNNKLMRQALLAAIYNELPDNFSTRMRKAYGVIPAGIGGSIYNTAPEKLPVVTLDHLKNDFPSLNQNHIPITIHESIDFKNTQLEQRIINAAKRVHLDIQFKTYKNYSLLWNEYEKNTLDAFVELYVFRDREAYSTLQYFTKQGNNDAHINDNRLDILFKSALSTQLSHDRFTKYRKIAQFLQEEAIIVPIFYMEHDNMIHRCLTDIPPDFYLNPFLNLPQIKKPNACKNHEVTYADKA